MACFLLLTDRSLTFPQTYLIISGKAQDLFQQALKFHQTGHLKEAESLYHQVLAVDADHPDALHYLGILAHQVNQNERAVELIRKALRNRPNYFQAHNTLGMVYTHQSRLDRAATCFRQALSLNPNYALAHYNLGNTLTDQGNLDEAIECYRRALTLNPDYVDAHINLGIILKDCDQLDGAVTCFRRALSLNPNYALAHYNLGNTLTDQGNLDEAIECYRRALTLNPDYVDAHINLGAIYYSQGKLEKAIASYQQALALSPFSAVVHNNLGKALCAQGKLEEGCAFIRKAIVLKPNFSDAHLNNGLALVSRGLLDEAVKSMQIAVENSPNDSNVSDELITLLNNYTPNFETVCQFVKTQKELLQIEKNYTIKEFISDEIVRDLYTQCCNIFTKNNVIINSNKTQLYRGVINEHNCQRHMMVFNSFKIIPEYCFGCFKVIFEPFTVVDLFKLLLIFDKITLKNDNQRKCIVEVRNNISGKYKGYIYCKDFDESMEILNIVNSVFNNLNMSDIPIFIQRGCSEFRVAYPAFGYFSENSSQHMSYNEEWRNYEEYADEEMMMQPFENTNNFTNNHEGFTLLDFFVMRNWLAYAKKIGDLTYRNIVNAMFLLYLFFDYISIDIDYF